jgi:hypothetical protein
MDIENFTQIKPIFVKSHLTLMATTKLITFTMHDEIKKYLAESLAKKRGLTFYINGNTVNGYVTRIVDDETVEVTNQTSTKVLVILTRLDAVAMS